MMSKKIISILLVLHSFLAWGQDRFTFVFLHKRTDLTPSSKDETARIMEGHMANIKRLAGEGKLIIAGPFDGGGGIFVFKSGSMEEVKGWLDTDPGVQARRWNVEILPFQPRIGGVCAVAEPYEMVNYHFIHYKPKVMKFNIQDAEETVARHDVFVRSMARDGNVISHASFGGIDGGILVLKGDLIQDSILEDPAVKEALFEPEFKHLWIARGSFCEQRE